MDGSAAGTTRRPKQPYHLSWYNEKVNCSALCPLRVRHRTWGATLLCNNGASSRGSGEHSTNCVHNRHTSRGRMRSAERCQACSNSAHNFRRSSLSLRWASSRSTHVLNTAIGGTFPPKRTHKHTHKCVRSPQARRLEELVTPRSTEGWKRGVRHTARPVQTKIHRVFPQVP